MDVHYSAATGAASPLALIFADSEGGGHAAMASVSAAGGRVGARLTLAQGVARLKEQSTLDAVLIDISNDHGAVLDQLLNQVDGIAARENVPAIITMPPELIDTVSARVSAEQITLLCQPDAVERVAALSCAWIGRDHMVQDVSPDLDGVRLRRLADEVTRIARALANLSGEKVPSRTQGLSEMLQSHVSEAHSRFSAEPAMLFTEAMPDPTEIRALLRLRRLRDNFFDPSLFADPAWDMLLDLMAARIEGDQVAVSSLCIAAAVPPTTALRWIKAMTDHHLFERHADPTDGRRIFIRLADDAANGMARYFAAANRLGGMNV
jgi:DNA-binding MarR family transcriptional regulator